MYKILIEWDDYFDNPGPPQTSSYAFTNPNMAGVISSLDRYAKEMYGDAITKIEIIRVGKD